MLTLLRRAALLALTPAHAGAEIHQKVGMTKVVYDFAVDGGAVSTILLLDDAGVAAILPDNTIITKVSIDILTAFVSVSNNGTITLDSEAAGDLLGSVDADTLSGINAGIPVDTAATAVKLTAERQIALTIGTNAMTAGKANFFVEWVYSD